jgi:hypothetical protein
MGRMEGRYQRRFVHMRKIASRCAFAAPSARDGRKRFGRLFAKEIAQVRIEHQVEIAGAAERREDLSRRAEGEAVEMRRFVRAGQSQRQLPRPVGIDGHVYLHRARAPLAENCIPPLRRVN